jgi:hypothetical protein
LPDTPSAEDLAYKGLSSSGVPMAREGAKIVAPIVGGLSDPLTWINPESHLASDVVGGAYKVAAKPLVAAAEGVDAGAKFFTKIPTKAFAKAGEIMTGGDMNAEKAYKAMRELSGPELLAPSFFLKGAGKDLGKARDMAAAAGAEAGDLTDKFSNVSDTLSKARKRNTNNAKIKMVNK